MLAGVSTGLWVMGPIEGLGWLLGKDYLRGIRRVKRAYSSKCIPRFGLSRRFILVFKTLRSGRTTITGTGECDRQYLQGSSQHEVTCEILNKCTYLDTLPIPPNAAPRTLALTLLCPRVPTTRESGRYSAISRSIVCVTLPAINSIIIESYTIQM